MSLNIIYANQGDNDAVVFNHQWTTRPLTKSIQKNQRFPVDANYVTWRSTCIFKKMAWCVTGEHLIMLHAERFKLNFGLPYPLSIKCKECYYYCGK